MAMETVKPSSRNMQQSGSGGKNTAKEDTREDKVRV